MVEVDPITTDRYQRTVALVRVGTTVINEELIREGLARVFTRYRGGAQLFGVSFRIRLRGLLFQQQSSCGLQSVSTRQLGGATAK
jgi:endonuclease YncB( thermonuclease family)